MHSGHGHHQAAGLLTPKAVQFAADPSFQLHGPASERKDLAPWGDRKPVVVLDLDRGEKPQGYLLPLNEISPLYGKTWREIGLDAFANHRSQGIAVFLGSPFLRRPVALKREDGGELNPAILAQPLGPLDEDYEEANMGVDPLMRAVDSALVEARDAALRLDWKTATSSLAEAGRKLNDVPKPSPGQNNPEPLLSLARSTARKREKIEDALELAAGTSGGQFRYMNGCASRRLQTEVKLFPEKPSLCEWNCATAKAFQATLKNRRCGCRRNGAFPRKRRIRRV